MQDNDEKIRVAIIGGGCAAMAAAFELTQPEHRGRYHVDVYQVGWRLGGKGASGRGGHGRIEEHGLHVWMGWYENAFRLVREAYSELGRDWRDAFTPASLIAVTDEGEDGSWVPWTRTFPPMEGLPGEPHACHRRWTARDYLLRTVRLVRSLLEDVQLRYPENAAEARGSGERSERAMPESFADAVAGLVHYGEVATLAGVIQGVELLESVVELATRSDEDSPRSALFRFLDTLATNARQLLEERLAADPDLERVWQVIDLALATIRGQLRFGLFTDPRGYDAIDDYDCREWLLLNGASRASVNSGYMRGLYDLGFAYEDGDVNRPRVSAAQALRGFMRAFFTYRGAFFWKMEGGMGDIVFAPLYQALRRRGVRFHFFHRLRNVKLAPGSAEDDSASPHVAVLEIDVQARTQNGRDYEPLVEVGGLDCWPAEPDFAQLADGDRLRAERCDFEDHTNRVCVESKTLRVGDDFDFVVLGVGLGAIPEICGELLETDPRWRAMVAHVRTVATQAFQLWLEPEMEQLGWPHGAVTLSGFAAPFDTWADMRHLIPREGWTRPPGSLAYFCGVLPESDDGAPPVGPGDLAAHRERVRGNAVRYLDEKIGHLWPEAVKDGEGFRWDLLHVAEETRPGADPTASFESQYWRANVNPSDRYTLALPGSSAYRISPLDPTYDNLSIAGDWTDCGFNQGCVESAVMSGRLAAHALSKSPPLEEIVGFDHP